MERINQNIYRLQRFQSFEIELARLLGGWLPGIATWENKQRVGRHLWEDAQHSREIRARLWELRKPDPDSGVREAVLPAVRAVAAAQHEEELVAGTYLVFKQALLEAYEQYIETTFDVYDSPTIPMLRRLAAEKKAQIAWAQMAVAALVDSGEKNRRVSRWKQYARDALASVGGVNGVDEGVTGELPEPLPGYATRLPFAAAERDGRFIIQAGTDGPPPPDDRLGQTVWQFMNYGQEMQAAETLGSVLWEVEDMPWEFYYDIARHCWDEVRHVQLGEQRLAELGYHIADFPQTVGNYAWRQLLDPMRRYCVLTYVIEADSFKYKHQTYKDYLKNGDSASAEAVLFDIMDETLHVRWGKKWVPQLMSRYGYEGDEAALETECRAITAVHSLAPQQVGAAAERLRAKQGRGTDFEE